jgi:hypothetical protein
MAISKDKLITEVNDVNTIIDIAIETIQKFPPKELNASQVDTVIQGYKIFKKVIKDNASRLKYGEIKQIKHDALIYFQEGSGIAVNNFWKEIKSKNIKIERVNLLDKILKKNKISNLVEYDYVIDTIVPLQQENLINEEQVLQLTQMLEKFKKIK